MFAHRRRSKRPASHRYPVLSDKPVEIHNPKRKIRIIAALFGLAIAVSSIAGAVVATTLANEQTSDSKRQLLGDIAARAKQRDEEAAHFQSALDQYRIDQCEITARLPQDPPVIGIRIRYRCDNPVATPTPAPQPSGSTTSPGRSGAAPRAPGPRATGPPPGPAAPARPPAGSRQPPPAPAPAAPGPAPQPPLPTPAPSPAPPVCLPILGICVF